MWRDHAWQAAGRAAPRRWPIKLAIAVVMSVCMVAWVLLAGILHAVLAALS